MAQVLAEAAAQRRTMTLGGRFSKRGMAGPVTPSDLTVSTCRLNRLLQFEPKDLTVSVQAGMPYRELTRLLAAQRLMLPLDPPSAGDATVGGVLGANLSGPRRRLYGTARDMVIGMTFATLEGKLVQTGGMVVKNVAGLDMAKLLIGSFGTLAAIVSVNFKLYPMPAATRTFVQRFAAIAEAIEARNAVLRSVLQPAAIDLLKTAGEYQLLIQAGGTAAVLDRYTRELAGSDVLEGAEEEALWQGIREMPRDFLTTHENGAVVRVPCPLADIGEHLNRLPAPSIARAGSGVVYGYFANAGDAAGEGLIEFAPQTFRETHALWKRPGDDFAMMEKVKRMFDPDSLLNRGRLYGRI